MAKLTFLEKYRKLDTWQSKALHIKILHELMIVKRRGKWSVRKTAKYFGISLGAASEDLRLAENIEGIREIPKRIHALKKLGLR